MATTRKMKTYAQLVAERLNIDPPADLDDFVQVRGWLNAHSDQYIEQQRLQGAEAEVANDNPLVDYLSLAPKNAPGQQTPKAVPTADFPHFFAESKDGKEVLYRWRKDAKSAFTDYGDHIRVHDTSPAAQEAIIQASLDIAKERGWREVEVTGTKEFRRQVWLEANLAGLHCRGYVPTPEDKAELEKLRPGSAQVPLEDDLMEKARRTFAHNNALITAATTEQEKVVPRSGKALAPGGGRGGRSL